jgi:hypothetical protein
LNAHTLRLIVVTAFACNQRRERAPVPVLEPVAPKPREIQRPPEGLAKAAIASLPRTDWPCGKRVTSFDGESVVERFVYGNVRSCIVPVEAFPWTLGGCPSETPFGPAEHGSDGRMTKHFVHDYEWGKVGLKRDLTGSNPHDYTELDGDIVRDDGPEGPNERWKLDTSGRLVRHEQNLGDGGALLWAETFEYQGPRVVRIVHESYGASQAQRPTEVLYKCD